MRRDKYERISLRVAFAAAATTVAGLGAIAVGALVAPVIVPAAVAVTIGGVVVEAGTIMHGIHRAYNP